MLRDGKVTFAEYRRATDAVIDCLKDGPVDVAVTKPRPAPGGELDYTWSVRGTPGEAEPASRRFERCHKRFEQDVKLVYSNQRVIPPSKRPAVLAKLVGCLRSKGLEVPAQPAMPKLIGILNSDRREVARPCTDRYADFFRIPAA